MKFEKDSLPHLFFLFLLKLSESTFIRESKLTMEQKKLIASRIFEVENP